MRLMLLTSARGWGGTTLTYTRLARGLARRGHAVQVLARSGELATRFAAHGVSAVSGSRATGVRRRIRRFAPDALLADLPRDLRIATAPGLGRPAVVYRYNRTEARPRAGLLDRMLAGRVAGCIYQSEYVARRAAVYEPWLARRPSVLVPNGYDLDRFTPDPEAGRCFRRRHGLSLEAAVVLTPAGLTRDKGHGDAIAALGRIGASCAAPIYVAAGEGPLESRLRHRAEAEQVRLLVTGWLEGEELNGALNAADLVLHPSLHENFPNAVGEAMACGRPVVATDVGGTPELLGRDGEAGVLVPSGDPPSLAAALVGLLGDRPRLAALGAAARRRVVAEFPLARMVNGVEAALRAATAAG
jgi:glycosyltransferase involved in cell wall biosynthesis